jgi:sterol desaturase/sphingolipid hydroxylase (fatty acid hydroxylase superfamily)
VALLHAAGLFVVGWLAWTLAEYVLHRFVFHWCGPQPWLRRFHFIFHGVHHDFPNDDKRLVMPLGVSIPVFLVFFLPCSALFGVPHTAAAMAGFGVGYLAYDGVHYFTHHMKARSRVGRYLKRFHMVHHFTGHDAKWGVSSPLWDVVFGTMEERKPSAS